MKRRHKGILFLLGLVPLSLGSATITIGSIYVSEVDGTPLIAGKSQSLVFTIKHNGGNLRNIFDFVFTVSENRKEVFSTKKSFYKVPNGNYKVYTMIPGSVLKKYVTLEFKVRCERTFDDGSYVCYSFRNLGQMPREAGLSYTFTGGKSYCTIQSLYYPSVDLKYNSYFKFLGIEKKRANNSRRLGLENIRFTYGNIPKKYTVVNYNLGELRVYTYPKYWKDVAGLMGTQYAYFPLTYTLDEGYYKLKLLNTYCFSQETGKMMTIRGGHPRTNDLILPYWATEERPLQLKIILRNLGPGKETVEFWKEAYHDGKAPLGGYSVVWEEK